GIIEDDLRVRLPADLKEVIRFPAQPLDLRTDAGQNDAPACHRVLLVTPMHLRHAFVATPDGKHGLCTWGCPPKHGTPRAQLLPLLREVATDTIAYAKTSCTVVAVFRPAFIPKARGAFPFADAAFPTYALAFILSPSERGWDGNLEDSGCNRNRRPDRFWRRRQ